MAKTLSDSVYRIIDAVGVSETSWEDAGIKAVETAAGSLRMKVDNGKVTAFRTRVALRRNRNGLPGNTARTRLAGPGSRLFSMAMTGHIHYTMCSVYLREA